MSQAPPVIPVPSGGRAVTVFVLLLLVGVAGTQTRDSLRCMAARLTEHVADRYYSRVRDCRSSASEGRIPDLHPIRASLLLSTQTTRFSGLGPPTNARSIDSTLV